ncbi:hypothetical protein ACTJI9_19320 [Phyllobacterium sp. 22552]
MPTVAHFNDVLRIDIIGKPKPVIRHVAVIDAGMDARRSSPLAGL